MPKIYRPQSAFMYPNGDIIDPAKENTFTAIVNGQTCIAYRVSIYDMNNKIMNSAEPRINLSETKYFGEIVEYSLPINLLAAGNEYKWSIAMYGNDVTGSLNAGIVTSINHNFETGDMVYVQTSSNVFTEFTPYYIGKLSKDTFALYGYLEGARNDAGRLGEEITSNTELTVSSIGISEQCVFKAYSTAVLRLDSEEINKYVFKFIPVYNQAEGLTVNSFEVDYYSDFNTNPINSGKIYSSKLEYEIDGLLSGYTYYIRFTVINTIGQITQTEYIAFPVMYPTTSLGVQPTIYNNSENSCIDIEWDGITHIVGKVEGVYSFVENYRNVDNTALKLEPSSTLKYENIKCEVDGSLPMFNWEPQSDDWQGTIFRMDNSQTGDYVELKYDNGIFSLITNGNEKIIYEEKIVKGMSFYIGIVKDTLHMIPIDMAYLQQFTMAGFGTPIRLKEYVSEGM